MPSTYPTSPRISLFLPQAKDYDAITYKYEYEDDGASFLERAPAPVRRWVLKYTGLTETEAKVLDDFLDTVKLSIGFNWTEPRDYPMTGASGNAYTSQEIFIEKFERPDHQQLWNQSRNVTLIKRPV